MGTDIHGVWQRKAEAGWEDIASTHEGDRHYLLFAWLGNVRNGFGFAGVQTHTMITPLTEDRGLPAGFQVDEAMCHTIPANEFRARPEYYTEEDTNPEDESYLKVWMGDHSFSWASGEEMLGAPMPAITRTGIVDLEWFKAWDGITAPESWSGGISGPNILVSTPETVTAKTTHVQIFWQEDTSVSLKYFTDEVRRLVALHGEIRFVFGFDS